MEIRRFGKRIGAGVQIESDAKVDDLLRQIGLSHTLRLTPHQIDYYHLLDTYASAGLGARLKALFPDGVVRYPSIDIKVREKKHRIFVSAVAEGGPAQRAGLVQGDELVSVNDLPFEPVEFFELGSGSRSQLAIGAKAAGRS